MKNVTRISVALTLLLALLVAGQSSAVLAQDEPDWQPNTTVQNIFENHMAWTEYTNGLDDEFFETDDRELAADLTGVSLGITLDYLSHLDEMVPETNCARQMWYTTNEIAEAGLIMYASMYLELTAFEGLGGDLEWAFENFDETVTFTLDDTPDKCLNRIDV